MALYVDQYPCHVCGVQKEVVHTGKPTNKDFSASELLRDMEDEPKKGEQRKLICFECESERMSD